LHPGSDRRERAWFFGPDFSRSGRRRRPDDEKGGRRLSKKRLGSESTARATGVLVSEANESMEELALPEGANAALF